MFLLHFDMQLLKFIRKTHNTSTNLLNHSFSPRSTLKSNFKNAPLSTKKTTSKLHETKTNSTLSPEFPLFISSNRMNYKKSSTRSYLQFFNFKQIQLFYTSNKYILSLKQVQPLKTLNRYILSIRTKHLLQSTRLTCSKFQDCTNPFILYNCNGRACVLN